VIYVNDAARQALVDEKKHERGFNPKANDWEFLVIDGDASRIQRREKTGDCLACHSQQKNTDFVFRSYLPEDVRRKLR
jgi:hypothetical protein